MPRPSRQIDQALLHSGRALYAELGCAGLSQRRVAEHAGVQPGMVHYHFGSKDGYLRAVLQQLYEELFAGLSAGAGEPGPALERLRLALLTLARYVRQHRAVIVRLATDAAAGHAVVTGFVADNAPRHLSLLLGLLRQAQAEGALPPGQPLAAMVFLMGAVVAPLVVAPALASLAPGLAALTAAEGRSGASAAAPPMAGRVAAEVASDDAIVGRIQRALAALALPAEPQLGEPHHA